MAVVKTPKCMQSLTVAPFDGNKIHLERYLRSMRKKSFLCTPFVRDVRGMREVIEQPNN